MTRARLFVARAATAAAVSIVAPVALVGCERVAVPGNGASGTLAAVDTAPPRLASSEPLPAHFGFGRAADSAQIARLAIAIPPDGRGLPPGSGTVADGAALYATQCAACHGAQGEGVPRVGAALIRAADDTVFDFGLSFEREPRKNIGNYWPYATTLFDYVRRSMPFDRPGSLTDDQVYAVTAYLLHRNGIVAEDAVMDARSLPAVVMPARDRFRPDDRLESTVVR